MPRHSGAARMVMRDGLTPRRCQRSSNVGDDRAPYSLEQSDLRDRQDCRGPTATRHRVEPEGPDGLRSLPRTTSDGRPASVTPMGPQVMCREYNS